MSPTHHFCRHTHTCIFFTGRANIVLWLKLQFLLFLLLFLFSPRRIVVVSEQQTRATADTQQKLAHNCQKPIQKVDIFKYVETFHIVDSNSLDEIIGNTCLNARQNTLHLPTDNWLHYATILINVNKLICDWLFALLNWLYFIQWTWQSVSR